MVRVHQGEQLKMIKPLYYYSVSIFLCLSQLKGKSANPSGNLTNRYGVTPHDICIIKNYIS